MTTTCIESEPVIRYWEEQALNAIYKAHKATIGRVVGYVTIGKRDIQRLTADVYDYVEAHAYDDNPPTIASVCASLAVLAGIPADDERAIKRFYHCVRSCHSYHVRSGRKVAGRSGKVITLSGMLEWCQRETSLNVLLRIREALDTRLCELNGMEG